eukprot:2026730-Ditylum_brightwellii.AAC.1
MPQVVVGVMFADRFVARKICKNTYTARAFKFFGAALFMSLWPIDVNTVVVMGDVSCTPSKFGK